MDSAVINLYTFTKADSPRNISISSSTSFSSSSSSTTTPSPSTTATVLTASNQNSTTTSTITGSVTPSPSGVSSLPAGAICNTHVNDPVGNLNTHTISTDISSNSNSNNSSYEDHHRHSHYKFSCNGIVRNIPIEVFRYEFIDRTMIIISQTGKFGTVLEVKPLSISQSYSNRSAGNANIVRDPNTGLPRLTTKVLLGLRDEPLLVISAQKLYIDIECSKPLVLCFGIQRSSIEPGILSDIMDFVTQSLEPL